MEKGNSVYFVASQVAALIGKHKYRPACRALLQTANSVENPKTRELCKNLMASDANVRRAFTILKKERAALNELQELNNAINEAAAKKAKVEKEQLEKIAKDAEQKSKQLEEESRQAKLKAYQQSQEAKEIELKKEEVAKSKAVSEAKNAIVSAAIKSNITPIVAQKIAADYVSTRSFSNKAFPSENKDVMNTPLSEEELKITEQVQTIIPCEQIVQQANAAKQESLLKSKQQIKVSLDTSKKLIQESEKCDNRAASLHLVSDVKKLEKLAEEAVQKKRGRDEEDEVLNDAELRMDTKIQQRNTEIGSLLFDNYRICGKVDGIMDDCIVEVKTRKRWFGQPPEYDIIQLRVYLKMFNKLRGLLIEENRDLQKRRETKIDNTKEDWDVIGNALNEVALKLLNANEDDVKLWAIQVIKDEEHNCS